MPKKLSSRWILAFDGNDHVLIENGFVAIEGDRIIKIGDAHATAASSHEGWEHRDYGNALIAPGFIDLNALADVDTTILGFGGQRPPLASMWSRSYAQSGRREVLTRDQRLMSARFAFGQLLLSGITTALPVTSLLFRAWAESVAEFDDIAALADELGLRLLLGPSYRSAVNVAEPDGQVGQLADEEAGLAGLRDALDFARRCEGAGPLVSPLLVPSTIETCSDELLQRTASAAKDLGIPFRLHCCQSALETRLIWQRSSRSSIGHLAALGVLGNAALLPHALELGGPQRDPNLVLSDFEQLETSGSTVVHCPLVVGRAGRKLESFARMRAKGIRIGLGTDTAPPDMLMNLQMGLAMSRVEDEAAADIPEFVRAATLAGAEAIGRRDLGRLEPGAQADLAVWDLAAFDAQPVFDPLEALFLMPPGRRARDVFVAGRCCVKDHELQAFDVAHASERIAEIFQILLDSFPERHWQNRHWRELFPPSFPIQPASALGGRDSKGDMR
ncbi:chlorohydrolase family protein [Aureimonas sp. AU22]|uniref:chlorohydrolase family protein n=1 Tax=Aureimonas sp. AU22 TaxID=1638162 RepID=UPI000785D343|nr:chlorohydrolase family protein [Aureimonas sp. AU22]